MGVRPEGTIGDSEYLAVNIYQGKTDFKKKGATV
jgi:hypothetical protein